ncbi:hypothetical protein ES703_06439 [subsurface metagenome]
MEAKTKTKTVFQTGQSLAIILPRDFCRLADIRKGDVIGVVYNDSALTVVSPPKKPKEE